MKPASYLNDFKYLGRASFWTIALVLSCAFSSVTLAQEQNDAPVGAAAPALPQEMAGQVVPNAFPGEGDGGVRKALAVSLSEEEGEAEAQSSSDVPPAPPAERKLVPARAMGSSARAVEGDPSASSPPTQAEAVPENTGLSSLLETYRQQASEDSGQPQSQDSLPKVSRDTMVALPETSGLGAAPSPREAAKQARDEMKKEMGDEAFDAAVTGMFPLTTDQIGDLLEKNDQTQEAAAKPPYDEPKPEVSVQNVSLDPGVMPTTIKTAVGNVTTLNILDATGAPWPVQDVTWAGDFEVVEPEEGGHIIRITPMSHFARGNIVIRLLTLKTPLTMRLETSREVVQYRVDARIPEYGPFATAPLMDGGKSMLAAGDSTLTRLLDGNAPSGMTKLAVDGVDGRTTAYSMNGTTYVRTPLTLLSPAWQSSVSSADGMNVYALSTAPVILLSDGGQFLRATLNEKGNLLDE